MSSMGDVRADVMAVVRWVDGHADIWGVFEDPAILSKLARALAGPFREDAVSAVLAIESRGFVLGPLVAIELNARFIAVRKHGGLLPGEKSIRKTGPDYRGMTPTLQVQRDRFRAGDRVLLVDDWAETGSQLGAVADMVHHLEVEVVGTSVVVSELDQPEPEALGRVHYLLTTADLDSTAYG